MHTKIRLGSSELKVCLLLVVATLAVYWQMYHQDFINLDDNVYVTANRYVQGGLSGEGVVWAFTNTRQAGFWFPLTWLSLMLDHDLYGLKAGGYKITNLLFHLANTLLLLFLLKKMTGKLWRSAFVAAMFALHPLHVESVAWVTERKDVLSTLFWLSTIWVYLGYVKRPSLKRYLLMILNLTLGLMAKPMLVTLPFALLLLDYWPLQRLAPPAGAELPGQRETNRLRSTPSPLGLLREKLPLIGLIAIFSVVTFLAQRNSGIVYPLKDLPVPTRLANSLYSYASYLGKLIWPVELGVLYPHPGSGLPLWQSAGAGLLLLVISLVVLREARRRPYLMVGWFWFLGTLVPAIGLVQVGPQAMADRFTYVPAIGLFIMVAWGIPDLLSGWPYRRIALTVAASLAISAAMVLSWLQVRLWDNGISLYEHTLRVTKDNVLIETNLGELLLNNGRNEEAAKHFQEALRVDPDDAYANNNLGIALVRLGRTKEAVLYYSRALQADPDYAFAHNNLGGALAALGNTQEAIYHFSEAVRLNPGYAAAVENLRNAKEPQGVSQKPVVAE